VKLETIPGENFFWTPLGKSYSCWEAEDQGPLKLFNVAADEVSVYSVYSVYSPFQPPDSRRPVAIRDTFLTM
jgi:hypothetical protein